MNADVKENTGQVRRYAHPTSRDNSSIYTNQRSLTSGPSTRSVTERRWLINDGYSFTERDIDIGILKGSADRGYFETIISEIEQADYTRREKILSADNYLIFSYAVKKAGGWFPIRQSESSFLVKPDIVKRLFELSPDAIKEQMCYAALESLFNRRSTLQMPRMCRLFGLGIDDKIVAKIVSLTNVHYGSIEGKDDFLLVLTHLEKNHLDLIIPALCASRYFEESPDMVLDMIREKRREHLREQAEGRYRRAAETQLWNMELRQNDRFLGLTIIIGWLILAVVTAYFTNYGNKS